jgi:phosphoribosylaminoimidazole-succinocarboxamide synthase
LNSGTTIQLQHYPLLRSGKVRDIYDAGDALLLVASDRLSAFDVVLPTMIPGKGRILTSISEYWFEETRGLCPNHLVTTDISSLQLSPWEADALRGRCTVGRKAERIDIECVVRGYLAGSGYKEYRGYGSLAGEALPGGLQRGGALPEPRFTPAIKNDEGHDENISRHRLAQLIGSDLASKLEEMSLEVFRLASELSAKGGLVLADTKLEFGWIGNEIAIIDELLTPDSSRYWDASAVTPGQEPPSFDKQIVRNWLESQPWDKNPPGPEIPEEVVMVTRERYEEVYRRLRDIKEEEG